MISVCIIDNDLAFKDGLVGYLQQADGITVSCMGASHSALANVVKQVPDIVIMDISKGGELGVEAIHHLKEVVPSVQVIVVSETEENESLFAVLKTGVAGYLLKKDPFVKILEAIRCVHGGEGFLNGKIIRRLLVYLQEPPEPKMSLANFNLTQREKQIFHLLMEGLSYKEIAARCFISVDTINSHIRKIYTKLKVRSRAEIAARFR
jgi:DNA-binding NarL/FixJ family response regulator